METYLGIAWLCMTGGYIFMAVRLAGQNKEFSAIGGWVCGALAGFLLSIEYLKG